MAGTTRELPMAEDTHGPGERMKRILVALLLVVSAPASVLGKTAEQVFAEVSPSVTAVLVISTDGKQSYQGSGIVVAPEIVTTNCHLLIESRINTCHQNASSACFQKAVTN
jgi:hypothetical protein